MLGTLTPNVIIFEVDACQRGADSDSRSDVLGALIINPITPKIDALK